MDLAKPKSGPPGSLILQPSGASEERPWLALVTRLPDSGNDYLIIEGMGGLGGILSRPSPGECGMYCHQNKAGTI